ncbi:hypothetical protein TeGR_g1129 [Tetraparma gracilis]|uniref:Uncharacterized protein n=1 Tax=Tetraparma gracilis TaxID=2962635 RepID=A0ABQ6ME93_9STRA|nr:hypothetical protein TeGR_g1129 [Tetraparma gracilis]
MSSLIKYSLDFVKQVQDKYERSGKAVDAELRFKFPAPPSEFQEDQAQVVERSYSQNYEPRQNEIMARVQDDLGALDASPFKEMSSPDEEEQAVSLDEQRQGISGFSTRRGQVYDEQEEVLLTNVQKQFKELKEEDFKELTSPDIMTGMWIVSSI